MATSRSIRTPILFESPIGARNAVNPLFGTERKFLPGTLEVFFPMPLNGNPTNPKRDFEENINAQGFVILIDPTDQTRLNQTPTDRDDFFVKYTPA